MKKAVIIHGFQGSPEHGWKIWLASELEKRGFKATVPSMPTPNHPKMNEWVRTIENAVGCLEEDVLLVGHSLGCIAILRYLECLKQGSVGSVVLVAGFVDDLGEKELSGFFEKPIDWKVIRKRARRFYVLQSDNDPYVPVRHGHDIAENLGAKMAIKTMRHFSGDDDVNELPAVLELLGL